MLGKQGLVPAKVLRRGANDAAGIAVACQHILFLGMCSEVAIEEADVRLVEGECNASPSLPRSPRVSANSQ